MRQCSTAYQQTAAVSGSAGRAAVTRFRGRAGSRAGRYRRSGEHALNGDPGPLADVIAAFFEVAVPVVIDGEQQFGGARDIHGAEYKMRLRARKLPERRSRDARPVRALQSDLLIHYFLSATFCGLSFLTKSRSLITPYHEICNHYDFSQSNI